MNDSAKSLLTKTTTWRSPMRKMKLGFGLLVLSGAIIAALSSGAAQTRSPGYSLEVDFGTMANHPDAYQCQATFRDLSTEEVLAAPKVSFLAGQPAKTETKIPGSHRTAVLTASVDEEGGVIKYSLEVHADGGVVSRHKATVGLS